MKIVLSGYYGFDNAGDEALVTAISNSFKTFDSRIEITVLSGNPDRTAAVHGVRAVSRVNPLVLIRELFRADLLISGGGSLLQDVTGPLSIPYYLGVVLLALLLRTPVVFYAQGIGPVNRRLSRCLIRLIANRVDLITLRDSASAELLASIGVTKPPVFVTADPVFSLRPSGEEVKKARSYLEGLGLDPDRGIIGVSLRAWEDFADQQIAEFLDRLAENGQVLLLPLQHPSDLEYSVNISRMMGTSPAIVANQFNSTELMGLISQLRIMVGMRLHSLIFAACVGTPFEGIAYDPKVEAFLRQFEKSPLFSHDGLDLQAAVDAVKQTLRHHAATTCAITVKSSELKEKADANAMLVLDLIRRTGTL